MAGIITEVFAVRLLIQEVSTAQHPIDLSMFGTMTTEDAKAIEGSVAEMDRQGLAGPPYYDLDWLAGSDPLEQSVLDAMAEADVVHPVDWK